jgi:hypothetical protein
MHFSFVFLLNLALIFMLTLVYVMAVINEKFIVLFEICCCDRGEKTEIKICNSRGTF